MNNTPTPYIPDMSIKGKIRRRLTRFASRKALPAIKERFVSFTFDDFPKSSATAGAKILNDQGVYGTYYVSTGLIGTRNHFGDMCDMDDIRRLAAEGHEIACHTANHIDCSKNDVKTIEAEYMQNEMALSDMGIAPSDAFAFPYGDVSFAAKQVLSQQFATLRGVQQGINHSKSDANQLLAVPLTGNAEQTQYAASFIEQLEKKPGWLIFYTHDVRPNCSDWGCTPEALQTLVRAAKSHGFTIAPVSHVYTQMNT